MTDERIDALIRQLDVPSDPDPDFVRSSYAALRPRARAARVSDASRIGRLRRDLRLVLAGARWPTTARPMGNVGLVVVLVLLVLATMAGLAVVGALNQDRPVRNGPSPGPSQLSFHRGRPRGPPPGGWARPALATLRRCFSMARCSWLGGQSQTEPGSSTSAELYDPRTGSWSPTGNMHGARDGQTATLLQDGTVLVTGGASLNGGGAVATAELYDPVRGSWTATADRLAAGSGHTATLLSNGKVLVVGGDHGDPRAAELYDPISGTWTATGRLATMRRGHTATLLPDGRVLVTGGPPDGREHGWATAELYDPSSGSWTVTGNMVRLRQGTPRRSCPMAGCSCTAATPKAAAVSQRPPPRCTTRSAGPGR